MSDIKALIAEAREYGGKGVRRNDGFQYIVSAADIAKTGNLLLELADALEAAQQTPAPSVREVLDLLDAFHGDNRMSYDAYTNLHDAIAVLEAVQQTPAVDREALAAVIHERFNIARGRGGVAPLALADQIIASGILQDAAEVEARGLELLIDRVTDDGLVQMFGGEKFVSVALLVSEARAQQVREGN